MNRRRALAAPFVLTFAVLPAACDRSKSSASPEPSAQIGRNPPAVPPPSETPPVETAPSIARNPPATPTPDAGAARAPDAGAHASAADAGAQPIPPRREEWQVTRSAKGTCNAHPVVRCPPNIPCNPPAARPFPCPPEMGERAGLRLTREAGEKECSYMIFAEMHCPPGASCNPPPPRTHKVKCPD